jgi:hypothetical protein
MIQFILGAIAAVGLSELSRRSKPKMANGGGVGVLSNKEKIVNLEFEDNTDRKLGRYDFSFETIDADGASILDYDGYIIESAAESRMPDNFEWGQNVPEDWENAEKYILDYFYEWKRGKYAKGGKIYIEFLNKKKNFQIDRKYFNTDEEAMAWGRKNLGNFNIDMLRYKYADGGIIDNYYIETELNGEMVEAAIFDRKTHDLAYTYNFYYSKVKCEEVVSFESTSGGYGYDYKEVYSEPTFEDCSSEINDYIYNHSKDWVKQEI